MPKLNDQFHRMNKTIDNFINGHIKLDDKHFDRKNKNYLMKQSYNTFN